MVHLVRRAQVFEAGAEIAAAAVDVEADNAAHAHDFVELVVVRDGTGDHDSSRGTRRLERGDVVWVRPGDWHGYRDTTALRVWNVYAGTDLTRRALADPQLPELGRLLSATTPGAVRLDRTGVQAAERWCAQLADSSPDSTTRRWGLLLCLLAEIADAAPTDDPAAAAPIDPVVAAAASRLADDPTARWTTRSLAERHHVSAAHLSRLFTAQLGAPPMAWLSRLRAERAAGLLIETELPVAEIGRRVGWPDPNYASRRFGQLMGCPPATYRRRFGGR